MNRDNGTYEALLDDLAHGTGDVALTWTPVALTWAEHDALKDAVRAACPEVDSEAHRTDAARHTTCPY